MLVDGIRTDREFLPNCVDIHSVSPHVGSTQGGTLITITGSSFGTNVSTIEVDVDGIPCHVITHNMTHVTCWSGLPHNNDLSIADADGTYSITASGYRFRGNTHSSIYLFIYSVCYLILSYTIMYRFTRSQLQKLSWIYIQSEYTSYPLQLS